MGGCRGRDAVVWSTELDELSLWWPEADSSVSS